MLMKMIKAHTNPKRIVGIDINENVIQLKSLYEVYVMNIEKTNFQDESFTHAFALDTLEHLENLEQPLTEIYRILKPKGSLIISMPTENYLYKIGRFLIKGTFSEEDGPCSKHFYNAKTLLEKIKSFGKFDLVKVADLYQFLHFLR
ncbi:MAG: methyltransferase domain-containing protein [Candidatus Anstonellales archaeon]